MTTSTYSPKTPREQATEPRGTAEAAAAPLLDRLGLTPLPYLKKNYGIKLKPRRSILGRAVFPAD